MSPDAKLRMDVYQEGQRAFNSGAGCPYTDWRLRTWLKGYDAAKANRDAMLAAAAKEDEASALDKELAEFEATREAYRAALRPVAKIHSDGYWTALPGFKEPLNFSSIEVYMLASSAEPPPRAPLTEAELRAAFAKTYPQDDALLTLAENNKAHWLEAVGARHRWSAFVAGAHAVEAANKGEAE